MYFYLEQDFGAEACFHLDGWKDQWKVKCDIKARLCSSAHRPAVYCPESVGEIKGDPGLPAFTTLIKLQLLCSKKL